MKKEFKNNNRAMQLIQSDIKKVKYETRRINKQRNELKRLQEKIDKVKTTDKKD